MKMDDQGRELGWNDEVKNDGDDFILLPKGKYPFLIKNFDRARYDGGDNLPACNMAKVFVEVDGGNLGKTTITHRLYLHSKCEGLICQFFKATGARKHGQSYRMDWGDIKGSTGMCDVIIYKKEDGKEYNNIKKFLDPEKEPQLLNVPAKQQNGFVEGTF